jgi:hypothetical protein
MIKDKNEALWASHLSYSSWFPHGVTQQFLSRLTNTWIGNCVLFTTHCRLNCDPAKKRYVGVLKLPSTCEYDLIWKQILWRFNQVKMRPLGWALIHHKDGHMKTQPREDAMWRWTQRLEWWVSKPRNTKDYCPPLGTGERHNLILPTKEVMLRHSDFRLRPPDCERIDRHFKPPTLWYYIITALGNKSTTFMKTVHKGTLCNITHKS